MVVDRAAPQCDWFWKGLRGDGSARSFLQHGCVPGPDLELDRRVLSSAPTQHCRRRKRGPHTDHAIGRSRGGLSTKINAVVDENGLPGRLMLTAGQAHDLKAASKLLTGLKCRHVDNSNSPGCCNFGSSTPALICAMFAIMAMFS